MRYITMTRLGTHGRFANSIFQYAFLRVYAMQHNLAVQTSEWVGEQLFNLQPSPVTMALPAKAERRAAGAFSQQLPPLGDEFVGKDFRGYAQYHTSYYRPYRDFLCDLFQPVESVRDRLAPAVARLDSLGRTRVGIHLRRGDYGQRIFYITPVQWYLDWLKENWSRLDDPVLYVASEDRELVNAFRDYDPQTAESLGVDLKSEPLAAYTYQDYDLQHRQAHLLDFFPDWYLLTWCEFLLIPNSTFSFTAAMLSPRLMSCHRSYLPTQRFRGIDPWDTTPLTYDLVEDYPEIEGVRTESNPYW